MISRNVNESLCAQSIKDKLNMPTLSISIQHITEEVTT